jgi:hypothetical protein
MAISTIETVNRYDYIGLSTDVKPTDRVKNGALFIETDTRDVYRFHDNNWFVMDDSVQYVWNPNTLEKEKMVQPYIDASGSNLNLSLDDVEDLLTDIKAGVAGYRVSDLDIDAEPNYYGFLNADGGWFIMVESSSTYRYIKGDSGYTTAWAGRAGLTYDYYHNIF